MVRKQWLQSHAHIWRRLVLIAALTVVAMFYIRAVVRPNEGDFKVHRRFAERLLAGQDLYMGGMHLPYPPFWALMHIPVVFVPMALSRAVLFPLGVLAAIGLLHVLRQLSKPHFPLPQWAAFWVDVAAVLLASRFLMRDLTELGVNTALVALTWLGIWMWTRRRDWLAGLCIGLVTALKCTPILFLFFFLWKRQWKTAGATIVAMVLFSLSPILIQGPATYYDHMMRWAKQVWQGMNQPDPSVGVIGPEKLQNISLRPAMARYLVHLPPDHPGRVIHTGYVDLFNLEPVTAGIIIRATVGMLMLALAAWTWRPLVSRCDLGVLWQLSGVSVAMLVLSPITWEHHCVAVLPAFYFIAAWGVSHHVLPCWLKLFIAAWVMVIVVLNRETTGQSLQLLLLSYHQITFALLALLVVVIGCWWTTRDGGSHHAMPRSR